MDGRVFVSSPPYLAGAEQGMTRGVGNGPQGEFLQGIEIRDGFIVLRNRKFSGWFSAGNEGMTLLNHPTSVFLLLSFFRESPIPVHSHIPH